MFVKLVFLLISFISLSVAASAQKTNNGATLPIVNGRATYLPKPDYPPEAKDFCAGGKVEIKVLISEKGDVLKAKATSGDELLRDVSVEAVKKAKFAPTSEFPVKIEGIVVYNFPPEKKCMFVGVVNKKAKFIPKPEFPKSCRCAGSVIVQIIIDFSGKVLKARAVSGNPLLRAAAVKSALKATFPPTLIDTNQQFYVRGLLIYKF